MPRSKLHRVVVTGTGAVTAFGVGRDALWQGLREGRSSISPVECLDVAEMPVKYAGEVKDFDPDRHLPRICPVEEERSVQLGMVAAGEALAQAGFVDADGRQQDIPVAAVLGSGLGPAREQEITFGGYEARGWRGMRPKWIPRTMFNTLSSNISLFFGLTGANHVIASACASASAAIGHALLLVRHGHEQAVLCGGADSPLCGSIFALWTNMRVLAKHDDPEKASRPFDVDRNGFVLSEAAAMVILESEESARGRGATILGEVAGYGASSDAHHVTAPLERGQVAAIRRCLADADVAPQDVNYVNAHGTATQSNDEVEAHALLTVFGARGQDMPISSIKSMLGHSMGASGAVEMIACLDAIQNQFVPPTINCDRPDPDVGHDYVPLAGRPHDVNVAISNSFGFGGTNSVLLVRRYI